MKDFNTPREIRQVLFQIKNQEATSVRLELFLVEFQDLPAPVALWNKAYKLVRKYENSNRTFNNQ